MPCITQHLANHTQIFKKSLPLKHNKPSQRNNPFKDKYLPKCEYLPECEYLPKCKYIPRYSHLSKYSSFSKFSTCVTPSIFLPRKISGAVFSGFTLCIFSLALCLFFLPVAAFCAPLLDQSLRQTPVVQAVKATAPAVVNINVAHTQQTFFGHQRTVEGAGSGVIINGHRALVLTNAHVIEGASQIQVRLLDGRSFEAEVIGSEPDFDLAVLRLHNAADLPEIALGHSKDIQIGEPVIAIGNPYGYAHTVTTGVVSALNRSINTEQGVFTDFIQTDAAINPGNSGGPLLNILGQLIGINTAILASGQGIGFAIPIDKAQSVLDELLSTGSVSPIWLGFYGQNINQPTAAALGLPKTNGLLITEIVKNTPAARAKLRPGDVLLSLNGIQITDKFHYLKLLRNYTQTNSLQTTFSRNGQTLSAEFKPEPLGAELIQNLSQKKWGIVLNQNASFKSKKNGVMVQRVFQGSPAAHLGLQTGDIIHRIGNVITSNNKAYNKAFEYYRMHLRLLLQVERKGRLYTVRMSM